MRVHRVAAVFVVVSLVCAAAYPVYDPSEYGGKKWASSKGDQVMHEYKYIGERPWQRPGSSWGQPKTEEVKTTRKKKPGKRVHTGEQYEKREEETEVEKPMHVEHEPKIAASPVYEIEPSIEAIPSLFSEPPEPLSEAPAEPSLVAEPWVVMSEEEPDVYIYEAELDYPVEVPSVVAVESAVAEGSWATVASAPSFEVFEFPPEEEHVKVEITPPHIKLPEVEGSAEAPAIASTEAPAIASVSAPAPAPVVEPSPFVVPAKSPHPGKHKPQPSPLVYRPKVSPVQSPVPPKVKTRKEKTPRKKGEAKASPVPKPLKKSEEVEVPPKIKKKGKRSEPCCCECGKKQPGCYCYPTLPKRQFPTYYRPEYSPYVRPGAGHKAPPAKPHKSPQPSPLHAKRHKSPEPSLLPASPHESPKPSPLPVEHHKPSKHSKAKKKVEPEPLTETVPEVHKKEVPVASPLSVTHEPVLPHGKRKETKKYEVGEKETRHHAQVEVPEQVKVEIPAPARIEIPTYHYPQERYRAGYPRHYYGPATRVKIHCGPDEYCKPGEKREAKKKAHPYYTAEKKHKPEPSPLLSHSTEETSAVAEQPAHSKKTKAHTTEETKPSKKCRRCKKRCKGCEPCVEDENGCAVNLSADAVLAQL